MWRLGWILLSALAVPACGSVAADTGATGGPASHPIVSGATPQVVPAGGRIKGQFTLPVMGTVNYTITDNAADSPATASPGHWDVSIISASELALFAAGQPYASQVRVHQNVNAISDSLTLPAGYYAIAIVCDNPVEDCRFFIDGWAMY